MTNILYKYRSINDRTFEIISNNQFWYASISSLNDPNEGMVRKISKIKAEQFIRKTKENQTGGFFMSRVIAENKGSSFYGLSNSELKKLDKKIQSKKTFDKKYRVINNFIKEKTGRYFSNPEGFLTSINQKINAVGILSLSENPVNRLMWSHYAESHSGIVIGIKDYDIDDYKKVKYNSMPQIPEMNLERFDAVLNLYADHSSFEIAFNDPALQTILLTKTAEWEYEAEWRGIKETLGSYTISGVISEIIFGLNCEEENRGKIKKILMESKNTNIKLKEIYKKEDSYELLIRDLD